MSPRGLALAALAAALPMIGAKDDDPLAGRIAGAPRHCIETFASNSALTPLGRDMIGYRDGARLWVSRPEGGCPALREFTVLIVEQFDGSQVCDTDRFRVLEPGETIPSAYCRFGPFVPYEKPKK